MSVKIENNLGVISIDEEVVARVAGCAAMDCYGIVGMAAKNVKDDIFQLLKVESLTKGIKVTVNNGNSIELDFHIIVSYGVSIQTVTDNLIHNVSYKVKELTGLNIDKIRVYVEGVRVID